MDESDSEIYLAPSDILTIPCGTSNTSDIGSFYNIGRINDNHVIIPQCTSSIPVNDQNPSKQISHKSISNLNSGTSNVLLEAVYHKGTWFAVNRKQLEEFQELERHGKLSEVRIVKLELMDLPEDLKLCLLENYQVDSNTELSDDEQFFTKGSRGGYRHLSVRDNFESDIHDHTEATLSNGKMEPRAESQDEDEDDDDDDDDDEDSSSSEGDWSGEDCNSSDDHGCRRICDDGRSASSDEDEECLLKD